MTRARVTFEWMGQQAFLVERGTETSEDHGTWTKDFDLIYTRV